MGPGGFRLPDEEKLLSRHPSKISHTGLPMNDTKTHLCLTSEMLSLPQHVSRWKRSTVQSLRTAEELLDWVETQGFRERRFESITPSGFVVKWR
jgi:hypothetical protein